MVLELYQREVTGGGGGSAPPASVRRIGAPRRVQPARLLRELVRHRRTEIPLRPPAPSRTPIFANLLPPSDFVLEHPGTGGVQQMRAAMAAGTWRSRSRSGSRNR